MWRFFDQRHEVAGWIVLTYALVGIGLGWSISTNHLMLIIFSLITLVGTSPYAALKLGPLKVGPKAQDTPDAHDLAAAVVQELRDDRDTEQS